MKLGIWLPVVHRTPPQPCHDWEINGDGEDISAVAVAAESYGYEYVCAPEHIALPVSKAAVRGEVYWDPISTLGFVAARTRRVKLVPLVLVASYHHPLEIAKRMGTLDRLSQGRVIIGMGVGSLSEEFQLLGANMRERGARTDDALAALHAARGARVPKYDGRFYQFADMIVDPGLRADMEFWIGGLSEQSIYRAIRFGAAWSPTRMPLSQVAALLARDEIRQAIAKRERPLDVCYVMDGDLQLDPLQRPDETRQYLRQVRDAGVGILVPTLVSATREFYLAQLQAFANLAA
jgi:probable F420-dependent oxidoreductase